MKTTIENTLFSQTQSLREEYLTKTAQWAAEEYKRICVRCAKYAMRCPTDFSSKKEYYTEQKFYYNHCLMTIKGSEAYIVKQIKAAEQHYITSIQKLALRIEAKSMNHDTLSIVTARVGENIESIFTDGVKTVRAWTIIASGPVQKPHYRYLVK